VAARHGARARSTGGCADAIDNQFANTGGKIRLLPQAANTIEAKGKVTRKPQSARLILGVNKKGWG
jgi:hypothetical protein